MDRRNFFKGMFGAALIATIPKSVMSQIEELPMDTFQEDDVLTELERQIEGTKYKPSAILYIYDDNDVVLGHSTDFNIIFRRDAIKVNSIDFLPFDDLMSGKPEWKVEINSLHVHKTHIEDKYPYWLDIYFHEGNYLKMIIVDKDVQYHGNVQLELYTIHDPLGKPDRIDEAVVSGIGELIMTGYESTNNQTKIRTAKRSKDSN